MMTQQKSRTEKILIRGLRYNVRHWGDPAAPRLFLLHGWMDSSSTFQFVVDALPQEVYVSFDIDALTFENCPHTGTPVSGGLTFNQAVWLLDTLTRSGRRIIGFDVVEVCPAPDERIDAITGARMLWKLCGQTLKSNES